MAKLAISDLQEIKGRGEKVVAIIVYHYQMARIADLAGADVLTVGDSLGRNILGQPDVEDCTVDDMMPFAQAVVKASERALVSIDMPMTPSRAGAKAVAEAARRFKDVGADMTKIDIRTKEEELFDEVEAVVNVGLSVFPQIGYPTQGAERGIRTGPEVRDHVLKWALRIQDAGAAMIDMTNVTPEIYGEVSSALRIPVIGGQATPEADGRITGFAPRAEDIGRELRGRANVGQFVYDSAVEAIGNIKAGNY